MKILILEDNEERQRLFRENLKDHILIIVETSKLAIKNLINEKWDITFIDHDLGGKVYVPSGENTGYEVAKFLEENKKYIPKYVIIHSLNVVGANNIKQALPHAVHIPFAWTKENIKRLGLKND